MLKSSYKPTFLRHQRCPHLSPYSSKLPHPHPHPHICGCSSPTNPLSYGLCGVCPLLPPFPYPHDTGLSQTSPALCEPEQLWALVRSMGIGTNYRRHPHPHPKCSLLRNTTQCQSLQPHPHAMPPSPQPPPPPPRHASTPRLPHQDVVQQALRGAAAAALPGVPQRPEHARDALQHWPLLPHAHARRVAPLQQRQQLLVHLRIACVCV